MILQLVAKEVREHRWAAIGVWLLAVLQFFAFVQFSLRNEPPTALVAATNFTWGSGPILAAYTARRLFVIEHEDRTIQLLRSLPVSAGTVVVTKFFIGLVYNVALNLVVLWGSAWVLRNQEILTVDWISRLSVQVATYVFAWFALASFHAQLGGYRFAVWLVFLVSLVSFGDVLDNPTRHLFWTAPLADDIETTRYATDWDTVVLGAGWGLVMLVATVALSTYRSGAWVDALFQPMSGRRRAELTGLTIVALLTLEVGVNASGRHPGLPPSRSDAPKLETFDPSLWPLLQTLDATGARIAAEYGLPPMPRVLLRLRYDDRPEPVLTRILKSGDMVIGVRPDTPDQERMRLVLSDVLVGISGGHLERVPATGVWALGFAPYVLQDQSLAATASRLRDASLLEDFDGLRQRYGRRGAEAAGWLAWRALHQVGGDDAVGALVMALFGTPRSQTGYGLIAARRLDPKAILRNHGVEWASVLAAWRASVEASRANMTPAPTWSLPAIELERPEALAPRLAWRDLPVPLERFRVELWWSVAFDLARHPAPQDALHVATIEQASGAIAMPHDVRDRIVATWVIDGEVQGWAEVLRP